MVLLVWLVRADVAVGGGVGVGGVGGDGDVGGGVGVGVGDVVGVCVCVVKRNGGCDRVCLTFAMDSHSDNANL